MTPPPRAPLSWRLVARRVQMITGHDVDGRLPDDLDIAALADPGATTCVFMGKATFAALVDASGYSTAIQEKYQGLLITESKLNIGGSDLAPGAYGFGFAADKFTVMNVANEDTLSVPYQTDASLKRAVPLKLAEDGGAYKLYAGKKWVALKPE